MQRLKRVFAMSQGTLSLCCASTHLVDIETCPHRGGKLRVIACIEDLRLIRKIPGQVQRRKAEQANSVKPYRKLLPRCGGCGQGEAARIDCQAWRVAYVGNHSQ
jgi:hypothetical protein